MHAERNDAGKHPETELHGDLQTFWGEGYAESQKAEVSSRAQGAASR